MTFQVFVYGTLKPKGYNYDRYCQGKVIAEIPAYTYGKLYHLKVRGYPAMSEGNYPVQGYVLTFADDTVLKDLDYLEDYQENREKHLNEYNRIKVQVYEPFSHQELGLVWGYQMTEAKLQELGGIFLPDHCWKSSEHY